MKRVIVLSLGLLAVVAVGLLIPGVTAGDSASELGDLSVLATALGVEPTTEGRYSAAAILTAMNERMRTLEARETSSSNCGSCASASGVASLEGRVADLERRFGQLPTSSQSLEGRVNSIERTLLGLNTGGYGGLDSRIRSLETTVSSLQSKIMSIENTLSGYRGTSDYSSALTEIQRRLSSLESSLSRSSSTDYSSKFYDIERRLSNLERNSDGGSDTYQLQSKIYNLENAINDLRWRCCK
jgi:chromosome segregation ATPase